MNPEVLIVGAGPTGLMLACDLARYEVPFRIIDKKNGLSTEVKASEVTPRSLEALEDFGMMKEVKRLGVTVHSFTMFANGKKIWHGDYGEIDSPHKYQVHLGQVYTEQLLFKFLQEHGGKVEWNTELIEFQDKGHEIGAKLKSPKGEEEVSAQFLAACDGASSTIRHLLNLEFKGHTYPADNLIGNVKLDWDRPPDQVYVFFSPEGEMTVSPLPDGYHQINGSFYLKKDAPSRKGEEPTLAEMQAMFDARSHIPGRLSDPHRMSFYMNHHRQVERQKVGNTFLLGDAAHIVSPNTGLGMNTGLQDARNLSWKLNLVLKGVSQKGLLESFQDERHGVLKALGQFSDMDEAIYLMHNPVARELRDHVLIRILNLEFVKERQNRTMAQADVFYQSSPITGQDLGSLFHLKNHHLSDHASCPSAWLRFGKGPHGGERASDVRPVLEDNSDDQRLHDRLRHGQHTLLLFAGCEEPGTAALKNLVEVGRKALETFGNYLEAFLVIPGEKKPANLNWEGKVLFDVHRKAHNRYGANGECIYLIRPDKFIGYRALPPDWEKFETYLREKIFTKA